MKTGCEGVQLAGLPVFPQELNKQRVALIKQKTSGKHVVTMTTDIVSDLLLC